MTVNPFKPEFTIVIFIHHKPRIAVAILDLQWMKMIWCGFKIKENYRVLVNQFYGNFRFKTLCCMKIKYVFSLWNDALMHREGLKGWVIHPSIWTHPALKSCMQNGAALELRIKGSSYYYKPGCAMSIHHPMGQTNTVGIVHYLTAKLNQALRLQCIVIRDHGDNTSGNITSKHSNYIGLMLATVVQH